jgi:Xaa-Pro aminopeptidase
METSDTTADGRYTARIERVRERLRRSGLDYCFVGPSSDLRYLTGRDLHESERLTLLVIPRDAPATLVVPFFETEGLRDLTPSIHVASWQENEDPARLVAETVRGASGTRDITGTIAVGDRLWAVFLLRLQAALPRATFATAEEALAPVRMVKDAAEVEALAAAGAQADAVFGELQQLQFSGQTERAVAAGIAELLRRRVVAPTWGPIVASGPNAAAPHHSASDRVMQPGDLVVLDYGGVLDGYNADMTRTVAVARPPEPDARQAYEAVRAAQEAGVQAARPGISGEQLDAVVRSALAGAGYGPYFTHRLGHGIGLDGHEPPYIVQGNAAPLAAGMTFSIEPGVYVPGRFGIRIEDIVALTPSGARRLNNASHELVIVK